MPEDDWSFVGDWTVVGSHSSTGASDDWSLLTDDDSVHNSNPTAFTPAKLPVVNLSPSIDENNEKDDHLEPLLQKRVRSGKRAFKHSLVHRYERMYGMEAMMGFYCSHFVDDLIEVVSRPRNENDGRYLKTALDDVFPELLSESVATLGRSKRWEHIKVILEQLEKDEAITWIRESVGNQPSGMGSWSFRNGRYDYPPHQTLHFCVKPNGSFQSRTSPWRRYPQTTANCGVQYVLYRSKAYETDRDTAFQRRYALKCGPSESAWGWGEKNLKAKKRVRRRAEIKEALKDYR